MPEYYKISELEWLQCRNERERQALLEEVSKYNAAVKRERHRLAVAAVTPTQVAEWISARGH